MEDRVFLSGSTGRGSSPPGLAVAQVTESLWVAGSLEIDRVPPDFNSGRRSWRIGPPLATGTPVPSLTLPILSLSRSHSLLSTLSLCRWVCVHGRERKNREEDIERRRRIRKEEENNKEEEE
jgi:hypothetical protein